MAKWGSSGLTKQRPEDKAAEASQNSYVLQDSDGMSLRSIDTEHTFSVTEGNGSHAISIDDDIAQSSKGRTSRFAGRIVNSRQFKRLVILLIVSNAILMGVATSDIVSTNEALSIIFRLKDLTFLVLFTVELALQLLYHQWALFYDGWLLFDFLVISLSWVTSYLLMIRTFRLVRTMRLVSRVQDLRNLAISLIDSIPKVISLGCLMILMFFIFAVVFTDMFKELYNDGFTSEDYFSRLDHTFFTLFQIMTLDGWSKIAKEVMLVKPWAWFPFVTFVIVSSYFFLNLIIAVVCESVFKASANTGKQWQGDIAVLAEEISRLELKIDALANLIGRMVPDSHVLPDSKKSALPSGPGIMM